MNLTELKQKAVTELLDIAQDMGIDNVARTRKQDIIFAILKKHAKSGEDIYGDGVLEILQDGFGFLRSADSSYMAGPDDIYVSPSQIRRFNLRKGDSISGKIRPPKEGERYFALLKVNQINFDRPENARHKILFENLTPLFPDERLVMEIGNGSTEDLTSRILDLTAPIGKGQRGLIVSPPKAGKTMMMQNIANAIVRNNPECYLIVLLIDERPEEVTEMSLFERFLNPERVSMPDFDVDFCMEKRDRVIDYVADTYGRDAVSQIVTFGTMAAKAVVRDVARAQGKPYSLGDRLSKMIPFEVGMTLAKAWEQEEALRDYVESDEEAAEIWEMALKLEGITRGTGKHAGGVVIAPTKLTDFSPLLCDEDGSGLVVQFDKNDVEEAGLVKFDFLGLRTLTIIDWALQWVDKERARNGEGPLDIATIPLDDRETFSLLQRAETTAVFQLESRGMKELIKRLKPDSLEDMIALVALFRPGPLQSGMVDDFINRKHGKSEISYPHHDYQHEWLKPVLEPTYGIILYQEQVMQIAQVLAGYTLGQADMLRRAMGKKKPEEMAKQRSGFMEGCAKNGIEKDLAGNIFDLVEKFAGYGFNKSHSAAYGLVSYQTGWLKTHYPASFMAAVISTEMDNLDKVVPLIEECRRMKLEVTPPDVNRGEYRFSVNEKGQVVYGLGAIRGVGEGPIEAIVVARSEGGDFTDLFDFCRRVDGKRLNKRTLEALIRSGALDQLGPSRAILAASLDDALKAASQSHANQSIGIDDMFGDMFAAEESEADNYAQYRYVREWTDRERLGGEKDTLGLYLTGHPIDEYEPELKRFVSTRINDLRPSREPQRVAGLVVGTRTMKSRRGDTIAFVTLDDRTGRIEASLFGELYEQVRANLSESQVMIIEGDVSSDDFSGGLRLRGKDITMMVDARKRYGEAIEVTLDPRRLDIQFPRRLREGLQPHLDQNGLPIRFHYRNDNAGGLIELGPEWRVTPSDELIISLNELDGQRGVRLTYR